MQDRTFEALDRLVEELSRPEAEPAVRLLQQPDYNQTEERRVGQNVALRLNTYFNEFVQKVSSARTPTEALDMALSDLKTTGFFAPRIYRRNNGYCDLIRPAAESFSFDASNPLYRHLFVEGNPFLVFNTSDPALEKGVSNLTHNPSLRLPAEVTESVGLRYSVPSLILQKDIEGIVVVSYNPNHLFANGNPASIGWRILSYVVNIVGMQVKSLLDAKYHERVIEEAQALAQENERLAIHDPLTGMLNRYQMFGHLKEIWTAQSRSDEYGAEFLLDSDRLKAINDTCGHAQGDKVLIEVAEKVNITCRDYFDSRGIRAHAHRYGGDEFVISARGRSDQSLADFSNCMEGFSRYLLGVMHDISTVPAEFKPTSASLGVVITQHQRYADIGETFKSNGGKSIVTFTPDEEGWHNRTDLALYRAKEAGRDQARLYLPDGTERVIRP
ncbi:MAG: GGDEF domain-containing protein [Nanoarchaeota archaeon]